MSFVRYAIDPISKERLHYMITSTKPLLGYHLYFANKSILLVFFTFVAANSSAKTSTNCQVSHQFLSQIDSFRLFLNLFKFIGFGIGFVLENKGKRLCFKARLYYFLLVSVNLENLQRKTSSIFDSAVQICLGILKLHNHFSMS